LASKSFKLEQEGLIANWVFLRYMMLSEKKPTTTFFHQYLMPPSDIKFNDLLIIKQWADDWANKFLKKYDLVKKMLISELNLLDHDSATELFLLGSEGCLVRIVLNIIKLHKDTKKEPRVFLINSLNSLKEKERDIENYFKRTFGWKTLATEKKELLEILSSSRKPVVLIPSRFWFSKGIMVKKGTVEIIRSLWIERENMSNKNFPGCIKFIASIGGFKHYVPVTDNDLSEETIFYYIKNSSDHDVLPFKFIDRMLVN